MKEEFILATACALLSVTPAMAVEYYVDNTVGDDRHTGTAQTVSEGNVGPFKTIKAAVRAAQAGDLVEIVPTGKIYRETVDLYGMKSGEPGKPITIDGRGVTVSGGQPCPPEGWRQWKDDVVVRDDFPWKCAVGSSARERVVFIIDGRLSLETTACDVLRPGEFCFIPNDANRLFYYPKEKQLPEIEVGQPDGASVKLDPKAWQSFGKNSILRYNGLKAPTWIKCGGAETALTDARERLEPGQFTVVGKDLYFRLPKGKSASDLTFEAVVLDNGVLIGGATTDVIIKNFNVRHVANDGYNIHGAVRRIEFHNCNATECGDEGFSSHDRCETLLDGAVYTLCDNGIANVNESISVTRNAICANCRNSGYEMQEQSTHTLENVILADNSNPLAGGGKALKADNLLIVSTSSRFSPATISIPGSAEVSRLTVVGKKQMVMFAGGGTFSLTNCCFTSGETPIQIRMDDTASPFRLDNVRFGNDAKIEYGDKPPFKSLDVAQWLAALKDAGKAQGSTVEEMPWADELIKGAVPTSLPENSGCGRELIVKFGDFRRQGK